MPEQFDKSVFREIFKIDNIDFTAGLIKINRKVNILDRYAERTYIVIMIEKNIFSGVAGEKLLL